MMPTGYQQYYSQVSLSSLADKGFEANDDGEAVRQIFEGNLQNDSILAKLTKRQRIVIHYLNEGYRRKEVARILGVCLQSIHEIVLRIRKRLKRKNAIEEEYQHLYIKKRDKLIKNLLYLYSLSSENLDPQKIFNLWTDHPVLKDYERPDLAKMQEWMGEFSKELGL